MGLCQKEHTARVINPTDEKITLKPETVISQLEFVLRKKEPLSNIICNLQGRKDKKGRSNKIKTSTGMKQKRR